MNIGNSLVSGKENVPPSFVLLSSDEDDSIDARRKIVQPSHQNLLTPKQEFGANSDSKVRI